MSHAKHRTRPTALHVTPQKSILKSISHTTSNSNRTIAKKPHSNRIQIAQPVFVNENEYESDELDRNGPESVFQRKKWQGVDMDLYAQETHDMKHEMDMRHQIHEIGDDEDDEAHVQQPLSLAARIEQIKNTRRVPNRSIREIQKQDIFDRYQEFRQNQHELHQNIFVEAPVFEAKAQMLRRKQEQLMSGYNTDVQWNDDETADFTMRFEVGGATDWSNMQPEAPQEERPTGRVPQEHLREALQEAQETIFGGARNEPSMSQRMFHVVNSIDDSAALTRARPASAQAKRNDATPRVPFPLHRRRPETATQRQNTTKTRPARPASARRTNTSVLKTTVSRRPETGTTRRATQKGHDIGPGWNDDTHAPALFSAYAKLQMARDARKAQKAGMVTKEHSEANQRNHGMQTGRTERVMIRGNLPQGNARYAR